jgi:hypothetical protein
VPLEEHLAQVNEIDLLRQIAFKAWQMRTTDQKFLLHRIYSVELDSLLSDYRHEFGFRKIGGQNG